MKLLIVEDNDRVSAALRSALGKRGFDVMCAFTAAAALELIRTGPDLVLLDIGLPGRDGITVCKEIRRTSQVPIIMATARGDIASRVAGLDVGADDYLVKPYNLSELLARIRAVNRRYHSSGDGDGGSGGVRVDGSVIVAGALRIDVDAWTARVEDEPITLTRKEFTLLLALARHPDMVLRHEQLIDEAWPDHGTNMRRVLHVHVSTLRQKLERACLIESVHGVGYRLVVLHPDAQ